VLKKRILRRCWRQGVKGRRSAGFRGFYNIFQSINGSFSNVNFPVLRLITSIPLAASVVEICFSQVWGYSSLRIVLVIKGLSHV
jgi:hypothetical protein